MEEQRCGAGPQLRLLEMADLVIFLTKKKDNNRPDLEGFVTIVHGKPDSEP